MLLFANVLFGLMAFVAKRAMAHLPGPEVAFFRFVVGIVAVAVVGSRFVKLRPVNLRALALRGVLGGMAVLLFFLSIEHLPVGTATLLNYTAPVFTAVDAALFLGEAVSLGTVISLVITMGGVVLVVWGHAPPGKLGFGPWELCGVASAILSGAAVTAIRAARRTDGAWEIFGAFCVFGAIATGPFAARAWVTPSATEWALMLAVGLLSVAAQVMMTYALGHVRAATAGVMFQITPVTALLLGVVFYGEPLGALALAGSTITLAGVSWAAWTSAREREREARQAVEKAAAGIVDDA